MQDIEQGLRDGLESPRRAQAGVVGHAGCGHAHSHLGFVQDDSGGLAAVLRLWQRLTGVDLTITKIEAKIGIHGGFTVETAAGGRGQASARRGITPYEARLAQTVLGEQAVCTQALAVRAFGRILGQGAMEAPVALQTAVAMAAISSLKRQNPDQVEVFGEGIEGNVGGGAAASFKIHGLDVSVMALVNASAGGIGPNEDVEGNVDLYGKTAVMERFGLRRAPTLLVEGKVCAEPLSPIITEPTFLIRAFPADDNPVAARAYIAAANRLGYPAVYREELLQRNPTAMRRLTEQMGKRLEALGVALQHASTAAQKVAIAAEINQFASEELGGITFMSEDIHAVMGGVGQIPGTTACMSLFIPNEELKTAVIPVLSMADADRFADMLYEGLRALADGLLPDARRFVEKNFKNPWNQKTNETQERLHEGEKS